MLVLSRSLLAFGLFCLLVRVSSANPSAAEADPCLSGPILKGKLNACRGQFPLLTFNAQTKKCEEFTYGGCYGTKNLFFSQKACEEACQHHFPREKRAVQTNFSPCRQPIKKGHGFSSFRRFAYDPSKSDCVKFLYGGSGGNANNFRTREDCVKKCQLGLF